MADVYVLDKNLQPKTIIDGYTSLIWADRYYTLGDCELYMPVSAGALEALAKGNYLVKTDSDMVCIIDRIEIDTDVENGNYLIVKGTDSKGLLGRRVIWNTVSINGNVEAAVRSMVDKAAGNTSIPERQLQKQNGGRLLYLGTAQGLTQAATEQISYKNVGETVQEICKRYKWGYKVYLNNGALYFTLYAGQDKTSEVIFSNEYDNLKTTKYTEDDTHIANVALVAGEGEGAERARVTSGSADYASTDRYEIYVDAKDISTNITYEELVQAYPSGSIVAYGDAYGYLLSSLDVPVMDEEQLDKLQDEYPDGYVVTVDNVQYFRVPLVVIATLESDTPDDGDKAVLQDIIYDTYLLTRGQQKISEYGAVQSFEGEVEPNTTFRYKADYNLGDVVTVENEYGITARARIVEVVEVEDDNGYSVQPKFEYEELGGSMQSIRLTTELDEPLLTENRKALLLERSASAEDGVKVSELPETVNVSDDDIIPIVSGGATKRTTVATLLDDIRAQVAGKQDELTEGNGIDITEGVISAELEVHQAAVTLAVNAWNNLSQTVSVTGLNATDVVVVAPAPASASAYATAGIKCTAQAAGQLTFSCSTAPAAAVIVNVIFIKGAAA